MTDFVQLQEDLTQVLLSVPQLDRINVVQLRKLRLQNVVDAAVIYTKARNGRAGCGILVEMPAAGVRKPNVPGPELNLICSFLVMEQPSINLNPLTGTQMTAEDVVQHILDILHQWQVDDLGAFYAAPKPFEPVESEPGVISYRVRLDLINPREQTARTVQPIILEESGVISFSGFAIGAKVFYTIDGSFPGLSNPARMEFATPFSAEVGTKIRWASYIDDNNPSDIGSAVVT